MRLLRLDCRAVCTSRNMSTKARIISTLRNTLLLSLLLGVTWITGAIPASTASLYISVVLNASQGLYILVYSVLANNQVRGEVRERMSEVVSTYIVSSNQSKVSVKYLNQTLLSLPYTETDTATWWHARCQSR